MAAYVELGRAFALYATLLGCTIATVIGLQPGGTGRYALMLVPMIGAVAIVRAALRATRQLDEMQRQIQLDGMAVAYWGTALLTCAWACAEFAGLPHLPTWAIWPILGLLHGVGLALAARRYR